MKIDLLFGLMAMQEADFFGRVARKLIDNDGLHVAFLTFHEGCEAVLAEQGLTCFSLHKLLSSEPASAGHGPDPLESLEESLGADLRRLTVHEMLTANRLSEDRMRQKVSAYHRALDDVLAANDVRLIVQELGGFVAPLMLFHVARRRSLDHLFIEPAMFPKRVVFTLNGLYADIPPDVDGSDCDLDELQGLLRRYIANQTVVIPKKDRHFFRDMNFRRLLSADNFRRLGRKLHQKYILGHRQEYDAIGWYIYYHVVKALRRKALAIRYRRPRKGDRYVYYPFHVPLDVQLTVRCPELLNQEALVEYIARSLPFGLKLYVKEHPASIGGHSLGRLWELLRFRNVRLIHPRVNSFDLIRNAECVITVNSKVGFEAIMQGKPVVVLGRTFYRGKGVTTDVANINELPSAIPQACRAAPDETKRQALLRRAMQWSCRGELYENSPENVEAFYQSLRRHIPALSRRHSAAAAP